MNNEEITSELTWDVNETISGILKDSRFFKFDIFLFFKNLLNKIDIVNIKNPRARPCLIPL